MPSKRYEHYVFIERTLAFEPGKLIIERAGDGKQMRIVVKKRSNVTDRTSSVFVPPNEIDKLIDALKSLKQELLSAEGER